jgi:hypothetical protein
LHLDRADPSLNQARWTVAVSHHALAPVRQPPILHHGQERLGFGLDGLGQQPAGAAPQDRRQRIIDRLRLTKGNNNAIAHRGVSLLWEVQAGFITRLDTPPFSPSHHPVSAIALRADVAADRLAVEAGAPGDSGHAQPLAGKRSIGDLLAMACRLVMWRRNGRPSSCPAERRCRSYDCS